MSEKFLILFFLLFSLNFTAPYDTVKKVDINLTAAEMKLNSERIEKEIRNITEKKKLIENIKNGYESGLLKSNRSKIEEKFLNTMFVFYFRLFEKKIENTHIQIEKIDYISSNEAIVTLSIRFPDDNYFKEEKFEREIIETFENKTGENLKKLDFNKLSEEKAKIMLDEFSATINEIFERKKINITNHKIEKKIVKAIKNGEKWEIENILSIFD